MIVLRKPKFRLISSVNTYFCFGEYNAAKAGFKLGF